LKLGSTSGKGLPWLVLVQPRSASLAPNQPLQQAGGT